MKLTWLADALRDANLTVVEEPGWETRGGEWNPIGAMTHHTAPPSPYPVKKLYGTRIKCNLTTQPGPKSLGQIHVVAAGSCNYSSGRGSKQVREDVEHDIAPSGTARERGLPDDGGGNAYYINNEVSHNGDGSPLLPGMYRHIVVAWGVICDRMDWTANRNIGHAEHTFRKPDPHMDGLTAHPFMQRLRTDVASYMSIGKLPAAVAGTERDEGMYQRIYYEQGYGIPGGDSAVTNWQLIFVSLGLLAPKYVDGKAGPSFIRITRELCGVSDSSKPAKGTEIIGPARGGKILSHYSNPK